MSTRYSGHAEAVWELIEEVSVPAHSCQSQPLPYASVSFCPYAFLLLSRHMVLPKTSIGKQLVCLCEFCPNLLEMSHHLLFFFSQLVHYCHAEAFRVLMSCKQGGGSVRFVFWKDFSGSSMVVGYREPKIS